MPIEYLIPHKHTLKILCKSKHFPRRYKRKREWVFFFWTQCIICNIGPCRVYGQDCEQVEQIRLETPLKDRQRHDLSWQTDSSFHVGTGNWEDQSAFVHTPVENTWTSTCGNHAMNKPWLTIPRHFKHRYVAHLYPALRLCRLYTGRFVGWLSTDRRFTCRLFTIPSIRNYRPPAI